MIKIIFSRADRTRAVLLAAEIALAILCGCGLVALRVGQGAWILGGIAAGAIVYGLGRSRLPALTPNREARKIGQMLIGLTVGYSIRSSSLISLLPQLPVFALLIAFVLTTGGAIALLYARLQKTDLLTAVLATIPGNIGIMASIAADYEKDTAIVSLVQLLRFTTVTLLVPLIAHVPNPHDIGAIAPSLLQEVFALHPIDLLQLSGVLALMVTAVRLGSRAKIPVAAFFCPILLGMGLNALLPLISTETHFTLPLLLKVVGQILLGLTIGEYWALNSQFRWTTIATATIPVVLTLAAGLVAAAIAIAMTPWDWLTCLLVTAPGGSPEMIWIALALNHDIETITAGHLIRLMAINLLLPLLVTLGNAIDRRSSATESSLSESSALTD